MAIESASEATPTTPLPEEAAAPSGASIEAAATVSWRDLQLSASGVIAVLLTFAAIYVARSLLVPIAFSVLASLMFAPAVRVLCRLHLPRALAAMAVMAAAVALVIGLITTFDDPARDWMARAPTAITRIEASLKDLRRPLQAATKATESLMTLGEASTARSTVQVVSSPPSALNQLAHNAPALLASMLASVFLTFLMLLHGEDLLRKFVAMLGHDSAREQFVALTREVQRELSRYLLSITLINIGLGLATAGALALLGFPDPLLWAGVVALCNFAPFVGPALSAGFLLIAGFSLHPQPMAALAAPGIFLALHMIEGQLITPLLVGRKLALDPVALFIALMAFGWLWGVPGLLMAVPLTACVKLLAQSLPQGALLAHWLGR